MELEALKQSIIMELKRFQNRIYYPAKFRYGDHELVDIDGKEKALEIEKGYEQKQLTAPIINSDFRKHPKVTEHLISTQHIEFEKNHIIISTLISEISLIGSFLELVRYLTDKIFFLNKIENNNVANQLKHILHIFLKIAKSSNYSCVIDYITADTEVFITRECIFSDDLAKYSKLLGFKLTTIETHDKEFWARDYYYTTTDQIFGNRCTYVPPQHENQTEHGKRIIEASRVAASKSPIFMDTTTRRTLANDPYERYSDVPIPDRSNFEKSIVQIEGGNLISAINLHGQHKYIIGEAALLNTISQLRLTPEVVSEERYYSLKSFEKHSLRYGSEHVAYLRERAKREIQKALNINLSTELVVVPQWVFHIDMQMAYLGEGQFIIHSFDNMITLLDHAAKIKEQPKRMPISPRIYMDTCIFRNNAEEEIIHMIQSKLKKHGFEVYLCAGALFSEIATGSAEKKSWLTNFMNGVAGEDHDGNRYFITADSPYSWFKDYFYKKLKLLDIEAKFINVNDNYEHEFKGNPYMQPGVATGTLGYSKAEKTVLVINELQGSVRCQTNLNLALAN